MNRCSFYNHRDKCGCGIDLAIIPASFGDDSKKSPAAPKNGQYQDTVVKYEASGNTYIYAHDGTYSKLTERAPVLSVNGLTGKVVLDAAAVGALPDTTVIPTKTSELVNDSNFVNRASLANVSFTGLYDDLIGYPTALSQFNNDTNFVTLTQVNSAVGDESTARENADVNLQSQIDALSASSDVTDIVGTYAALQAYDTSKLKDNDIIKVLQDESQNDETTYYRWSTSTETFTLIGEEGPYYTKSATDTLLNAKQDKLTAGPNITLSGDTISATIPAATNSTVGGIKVVDAFGTQLSSSNELKARVYDANDYSSMWNDAFVSKGTMEYALGSKQNTLTAGSNISISGDVISATDTTYSAFTGTDGTAAGTSGLVPAPATTDAGKFLKADGTWDTAGGGGPTVVQYIGNSTTSVMSQNATTQMVYQNGAYKNSHIVMGYGATKGGTAGGQIVMGVNAAITSDTGFPVSIGGNSRATGSYDVALGGRSVTSSRQEVSVGGSTQVPTRFITNVTDPTQAQDAATKNYVDTKILISDSAPTTSTVGVLGQLYTDTSTMHTYQCTDTTGGVYTWTQRW